MKPELVVDLIDKLVDERTKLQTLTHSKTLSLDLKKALHEECRKKIVELRAQLIEALKG